jgi:hypothetical protein
MQTGTHRHSSTNTGATQRKFLMLYYFAIAVAVAVEPSLLAYCSSYSNMSYSLEQVSCSFKRTDLLQLSLHQAVYVFTYAKHLYRLVFVKHLVSI